MSVLHLRVLPGAERHIAAIVASLLKPSRTTPLSRANRALWPAKAGVYALYTRGGLRYIGEAGNLKGRLRDLFRTRNHSFRRQLGKKLFSRRADYKPASTTKLFSPEIERLLTHFMERRLSFVIVPTEFARKEIEERVCDARPRGLMNVRERRAG